MAKLEEENASLRKILANQVKEKGYNKADEDYRKKMFNEMVEMITDLVDKNKIGLFMTTIS